GREARDVAVAMAFLLTMPCVPFLYYGDELGMRALDGLPSKEGGYGRTGCRTPMQWDASPNAGFSAAPADQLYLPVDPSPTRPAVAAGLADPHSSLRATQELIALRKTHPALGASGEFRELYAEAGQWPVVYERALGSERIIVSLNPTDTARQVRLPASLAMSAVRALAGEAAAFVRRAEGWTVTLPPVSYAIVKAE
ncbi:MAG TPA: alpha-glucosidase C-terminal domain-containing protein, partial [Opitutaceae bacterium]|nr:alpha-glucosidase C-terminal domain-containing protein [Opitutaceae bacterium]